LLSVQQDLASAHSGGVNDGDAVGKIHLETAFQEDTGILVVDHFQQVTVSQQELGQLALLPEIHRQAKKTPNGIVRFQQEVEAVVKIPIRAVLGNTVLLENCTVRIDSIPRTGSEESIFIHIRNLAYLGMAPL